MKPWYQSKKIWVAVVTGVSTGVSLYTGNQELAQALTVLGTALIAAFGLQDFGKATK